MSSVKMLAACRTSLARFIQSSERLVFITGAGVSTDSGIPDYRSPGRPPYKPMTHQEFVNAQFTRQRYWARSVVGYRLMTSAQPNSVHKALAQLEEKGHRCHIITQNVDELHQKVSTLRTCTHTLLCVASIRIFVHILTQRCILFVALPNTLQFIHSFSSFLPLFVSCRLVLTWLVVSVGWF
eukprot:m.147249 g.147249  ORF g.147249 m.147249 type:complete len:182 (+) comp14163_c0_seq1:112-657(+)